MKRLIVTICLAVVFVVGSVFADVEIEQGDKGKITMPGGSIVGGDQTNVELKNVKIGVGNSDVSIGDVSLQAGDNNNSNSNDNRSNSKVDVSIEENVQGMAPQLPWQLWHAPYPDEKFLWNQLEVEERELFGEWNKDRASCLVDSAGIWFIRGFLIFQGPMKVQSSFDGKYPKSDSLALVAKRPENVSFIGEVSVSGKDIKALICLGRAIEEALAKGATVARLKYGMNTVNKGNSAGIGGTYVDSSGNVASTGLASFGSANSLKEGEPAVILVCYRGT